MRVLKQGKLPEKQLYRGTCTNCRAEVECEQGETRASRDQRDDPLRFVRCPTCGKDMAVQPYPYRGQRD